MQPGQKSILVVNDEKEMLDQINRWLVIAKYAVKCTLTAEEGIELFSKNNFDLILIDYHLKEEKSGAKTARSFIPLFKNINPSIPIIIISATEPSLNKDELDVAAVFIVRSTLWKNLPLIVNQVLQN